MIHLDCTSAKTKGKYRNSSSLYMRCLLTEILPTLQSVWCLIIRKTKLDLPHKAQWFFHPAIKKTCLLIYHGTKKLKYEYMQDFRFERFWVFHFCTSVLLASCNAFIWSVIVNIHQYNSITTAKCSPKQYLFLDTFPGQKTMKSSSKT